MVQTQVSQATKAVSDALTSDNAVQIAKLGLGAFTIWTLGKMYVYKVSVENKE